MNMTDKRELAKSAIARVCNADNHERTNIFTVDDILYYYENYLKGFDY